VQTIHVPYHQDQPLPAGSLGWDGDAATIVEIELSPGSVLERVAMIQRALAARVAAAVQSGDMPLVASGDCLFALGTLLGLQQVGLDPALVWFDAHGDVHTTMSSTSGYLGGMTVRFAVGGDPDLVGRPLGLRPLREDAVLLVDARDLDPAEAAYLAASDIRRGSVRDVVTLPDGPLLLHLDLDVIDPAELSGLRFPAHGGPSVGAVLAAIDRVMASGRVAAVDIACPWHPAENEAEAGVRDALLREIRSRAVGVRR
jgi:arginase